MLVDNDVNEHEVKATDAEARRILTKALSGNEVNEVRVIAAAAIVQATVLEKAVSESEIARVGNLKQARTWGIGG